MTYMIEKNATLMRRLFGAIATFTFLILVQGCAIAQNQLHSLEYCNIGNTTITFIKIDYGEVVWPLTPESNYRGGKDPNCLGGSGIGAPMPIPEIMTVEWAIENGDKRKINIPIKSKLNGKYPLSVIKVKVNNDQIEVVERVYETPAKRVDFKIYP